MNNQLFTHRQYSKKYYEKESSRQNQQSQYSVVIKTRNPSIITVKTENQLQITINEKDKKNFNDVITKQKNEKIKQSDEYAHLKTEHTVKRNNFEQRQCQDKSQQFYLSTRPNSIKKSDIMKFDLQFFKQYL